MSEVNGSQVTLAIHIHTQYSACSDTRIDDIADYCRAKGVNVLGVTDHNTIAGALALKSVANDLRIIIGEEISTRQGEIIGLFLNKEIEANLDALETCKRIKDQGGLVYIPHIIDPFKIHRMRLRTLMSILDSVDIIEIFNAKASMPVFNALSANFAEMYHKIRVAGSDAHYLQAIDLCVNKMRNFSTPQEFLASLSGAEIIAHRGGRLRAWWSGVKNVLCEEGHSVNRFKNR